MPREKFDVYLAWIFKKWRRGEEHKHFVVPLDDFQIFNEKVTFWFYWKISFDSWRLHTCFLSFGKAYDIADTFIFIELVSNYWPCFIKNFINDGQPIKNKILWGILAVKNISNAINYNSCKRGWTSFLLLLRHFMSSAFYGKPFVISLS